MIFKQLYFTKRKILRIIIVLIAGTFLWIVSIINQSYISDYHDAVSVRFHEPEITKQRIDSILEAMILREDNHIPEITLWQRDEHIDITNEREDKSIEISLITVAGDMSRIYPVPLVGGGYLSEEDNFGCVIDKATAYKLFGSFDVVGIKINYDKKEYIIRGIIEEVGSNVVIIQEETSSYKSIDAKKYSCMELSYTDTENAKLLAEGIVLTNGIGTPVKIIDGYQNQKLSYMLIHIPLWLAALMIIIHTARKVYSLRASLIFTLIGGIGTVILCVVLVKVTNMYLYFPSSMIPNRWSDFDFWAEKLKEIVSAISKKEGTVLYFKDIMLRNRMLKVIIGVAATVICQLYLMVTGTVKKV